MIFIYYLKIIKKQFNIIIKKGALYVKNLKKKIPNKKVLLVDFQILQQMFFLLMTTQKIKVFQFRPKIQILLKILLKKIQHQILKIHNSLTIKILYKIIQIIKIIHIFQMKFQSTIKIPLKKVIIKFIIKIKIYKLIKIKILIQTLIKVNHLFPHQITINLNKIPFLNNNNPL